MLTSCLAAPLGSLSLGRLAGDRPLSSLSLDPWSLRGDVGVLNPLLALTADAAHDQPVKANKAGRRDDCFQVM